MWLGYTAVELGFDTQPLAGTAVYITGRIFALGLFEIAEKVVFKGESFIRVNGKGAVAVVLIDIRPAIALEVKRVFIHKASRLVANGKHAVAVKRHHKAVNKTEVVCVAPAVAQQPCQSAVLGVCHAPLAVTVGILGQGRAFSVNGVGEAVHLVIRELVAA